MPWKDRIREAAYTSPGGTRFVFAYEDVSRAVTRQTTGYTFPDAAGTYMQDLGHSGRRYPLRIIFHGADYDLTAESFEAALLETGAGKLEHPIYGVIDVVPSGTISRNDALKTAANQAIIEVEFWETIGLVYPTSQNDPGSAVSVAVSVANNTVSQQFATVVDLATEAKRATVKGEWLAKLEDVKAALQGVADTQESVSASFDAATESINNGIDVLIGDPLTLAFQTAVAVEAPARAVAAIADKIAAYQGLVSQIVATLQIDTNIFHSRSVYGLSYALGSVVAVVNHTFSTKPEAVAVAESILELFDSVKAWRDNNYAALSEIDTGEAYQGVQEAVALAAGYLIEISFTLKQERRIVLDRAHTIIDLVVELYGDLEQLDFFVSSNKFTGSELLEIPKGREIVYYV